MHVVVCVDLLFGAEKKINLSLHVIKVAKSMSNLLFLTSGRSTTNQQPFLALFSVYVTTILYYDNKTVEETETFL